MTLHVQANSRADATRIQHYFLGFVHPGVDREVNCGDLLHQSTTLLELTYRADQPTIDNSSHGTKKVGYWKIGITLADVDDVRNREWLWQRPYTVLELQHIWGTELGEFQYRVTPNTGFESISFIAGNANAVVAGLIANRPSLTRSAAFAPVLHAKAITVLDPDDHAVRVIESTSTVESDRTLRQT